ncbi:MAG: glycosyltransferase family 4 protein, partial [Pseudomonadota bacterium]
SRSGFNLFQEWASYKDLRSVYREEKPDMVHHITIKPVLYGSFAASREHVQAVVNAVPGMGFIFTRRGARAALLRSIVNTLYRVAFAHPNMRVIFQNTEDMRGFIGHAIVRRDRVVLIRGSGVELSAFNPDVIAPEPVTFVLVARMLRDKGVNEFAQAAAVVKERYPDWRFLLAGDVDPGNPSSLSASELEAMQQRYGVEWLGQVEDVPGLLEQVHVVCLPTYYREGLPKTLLEASAAGRAMVASDIAGCREVITPGVNGLLVAPRKVPPLADALLHLGENKMLRERYGQAARKRAEAVFAVEDVVEHTFRVYRDLLPGDADLPLGDTG